MHRNLIQQKLKSFYVRITIFRINARFKRKFSEKAKKGNPKSEKQKIVCQSASFRTLINSSLVANFNMSRLILEFTDASQSLSSAEKNLLVGKVYDQRELTNIIPEGCWSKSKDSQEASSSESTQNASFSMTYAIHLNETSICRRS